MTMIVTKYHTLKQHANTLCIQPSARKFNLNSVASVVAKCRPSCSVLIVLLEMVTYIDGLVQERRNSSALAMELHLSCTYLLIYASVK